MQRERDLSHGSFHSSPRPRCAGATTSPPGAGIGLVPSSGKRSPHGLNLGSRRPSGLKFQQFKTLVLGWTTKVSRSHLELERDCMFWVWRAWIKLQKSIQNRFWKRDARHLMKLKEIQLLSDQMVYEPRRRVAYSTILKYNKNTFTILAIQK